MTHAGHGDVAGGTEAFSPQHRRGDTAGRSPERQETGDTQPRGRGHPQSPRRPVGKPVRASRATWPTTLLRAAGPSVTWQRCGRGERRRRLIDVSRGFEGYAVLCLGTDVCAPPCPMPGEGLNCTPVPSPGPRQCIQLGAGGGRGGVHLVDRVSGGPRLASSKCCCKWPQMLPSPPKKQVIFQ